MRYGSLSMHRGLFKFVLLATALLPAGCNVVGVVAYKVAGPPKVPAKYVPPKEPMVVLVERYNAPSASVTDCETLAIEIFRELSKREVGQQIDPVTILNLRDKDPAAFKKMTISQIGAAVTAKQVIYVNLLSSSMESAGDGALFRGMITGRVKVIDVATGATAWPQDAADGYPIAGEVKPNLTNSGTTPEAARVALIRQMAFSTSRLFYKWTPEDEIPDD
ncbi:MAG TPA: hypothetical protein PLD59_13690 [Tepidisphaeraceae bacterium]|nr:hypothetical protein [Tepidisphaeraceae bacterium]